MLESCIPKAVLNAEQWRLEAVLHKPLYIITALIFTPRGSSASKIKRTVHTDLQAHGNNDVYINVWLHLTHIPTALKITARRLTDLVDRAQREPTATAYFAPSQPT